MTESNTTDDISCTTTQSKLTFAAAGRWGKFTHQRLHDIIVQHGGAFSENITNDVNYVFTSLCELDQKSQKIIQAKEKGCVFLDFGYVVACALAKKLLPVSNFTIQGFEDLEPPKKRQRIAERVGCVVAPFVSKSSNKTRKHFGFLLDYLSKCVASSSASCLHSESNTEMDLSRDMLNSPKPLRKRKRSSMASDSDSEESGEESYKPALTERSDAAYASSYTLDEATTSLLKNELGLIVVDLHFSLHEKSPFHYKMVNLNYSRFNKEAPIIFQVDYLREYKHLEGSEGEQQYAVSLGELFQHRNILKSAMYDRGEETIEGAVAKHIVTFLSNVTSRSQVEIEPKKMHALATQQPLPTPKEDTFKGQDSIMHTFWKVMADTLKSDELLGIILSRLEKDITTPLSFSPAIYWAVKEFKEFGEDKHTDVIKAIIQASKQSMATARLTGVCAPVLVQIAAGRFMKLFRVERMPRQLYEFTSRNNAPVYSKTPLTEAIQAEMQRMLELAELEAQGKPKNDAFYRSAQRLQAYLAAYEMYFDGGLEYVTVISSLDNILPFNMVDMTKLESDSMSKFIERFDTEILYLFNSWMEFFGVQYSTRQKLPTHPTGFASHPFRSYKLLSSTHPIVLITQWDTTKKAMIPTSVLKESKNASIEAGVQQELFTMIPEYMPELIAERGNKYLLMKYKGVDLATFLNENEPLRKPEKIYHTVQQVLSLLVKPLLKLHSCKVSHRDIKETNILVEVDSSGNIAHLSLCDFESAMGDSVAGKDKFTAGYIAPELLDGIQHTLKEDIYSLGVMICKIFWSNAIYDNSIIKKNFAEYGKNHFEQAINANSSAFDYITSGNKLKAGNFPEQLATLLREMTRVDHTKRYDAKQVDEYLAKNSWSTKAEEEMLLPSQ